MNRRRASTACIALAIAAAGFSAAAAGQTVTLNQGGQGVRIAIGGAATLPADFPQDIALPQPHRIVRVQRSDANTTVELEAPGATVDEAAGRFHEGMMAAGWTAAAVDRPAEGRAEAWEKPGRAVVAWLVPAPAGVRVQVELLPRRGGTAAATP